MKATVSTKGQIILPAEIRQRDGIEPGQEFDIERVERGEYRLRRREPPANEGLVDWLLACPKKATSCLSSPSRRIRCDLSGRRERSQRAHEAGARSESATTGLVHGFTVVTRNLRDFKKTGVKLLDPFP
jgi:AbrB family looped-hinge helix DNA binding protein